jgi:hypothetical protein
MMTWAGWTLNHRKPSRPPMSSAQRAAGQPGRPDDAALATRAHGDDHVADKAKIACLRQAVGPSVMLTALLVAAMANAAMRMAERGRDVDGAVERREEGVMR